jgi:quercetin dioxygenase-like cupin family protein
MKVVIKEWGLEYWIVNKSAYCGKKLELFEGMQCSLHHHKVKDETFYVVSGKVAFELDGRHQVLESGDSIHVPPLAKHRFGGIEPSVIMEFSTYHSDDDTYRDEPSGRME